MALTYDPLTGDGTFESIRPYVASDRFGYQDAEAIRQALAMLMYGAFEFQLGGSEGSTITSATWIAVSRSMPRTFVGANFGGLIAEAVLYTKCLNVATSCQVRVWNETDLVVAASGTIKSTVGITEEVVDLTLASGSKKYVLQIQGGNASNAVAGWGYIRLRKIPA